MEKPDLVYIYANLILKGIWYPSVHVWLFDFWSEGWSMFMYLNVEKIILHPPFEACENYNYQIK